jgi:hypothetical protein
MSGMEGLLQEMRRRPLVECVVKENRYKKREIIARRARIRLAASRKKKEKGKRLPRGAPGEARSRSVPHPITIAQPQCGCYPSGGRKPAINNIRRL